MTANTTQMTYGPSPGGVPWAAAVADQRFTGVVIGKVTGVNDPDGLGRVRIKLPWYYTGYEEWARIAQFYAGPGFGSTWVPEENCEVLISFAHGDMRWPYVLGCLYSRVNSPLYSRTESSDIRSLMTPAGSELSFDETSGLVTVKTANGASIVLAEESGEITLTATSKITLSAPEIVIDAGTKGKVTVSGGQIALN